MNYKRFQLNLIHLSAIDSTNNYAANLLKKTNVVNGTTILTKRQDFGRGQRGNSWQTAPSKNLIQSTIVFPLIPASKAFYLNIATSLAVEKTLSDLQIAAKIKWPNDIFIRGKKICGILIETQIHGNQISKAILGIGLNVNQSEFKGGVEATSVVLELENEITIEDIQLQLFGYLDFYFDHLMNQNYALLLRLYYDKLYKMNELSSFKKLNNVFQGVIKGIDSSGKLIIKTASGEELFDLGEVKFIH